VAWFRPMGVEAVAYHEATVVGRADDHEGQALDYYGSRGETPLRWGGTGAHRLGLSGEVTAEAYRAAFGPGGFIDPILGDRLTATQRPGFELVVSAHKSVAVLGVIGRADDMHAILDTETEATLEWLDTWFQHRGGRRGRAQVRTSTSGLVYATTRHGTSRDGDPGPHDHVLVANVVEMLDTKGGFKGLDSASLRDTVEAATMVGRLASAARAIELGYAIEPDAGRSGRLRHWRIAGIPREVCDLFSKRADAIDEYLAESGYDSPRARAVAARKTRTVKRHTGVDELLPGWIAELETLGWNVERLSAALTAARESCAGLAEPLSAAHIDALTASVLDIQGDLLRDRKVFTRTRLIVEVAPLLYGSPRDQLDRVIERMLAARAVVPLIGVAGAHEQAYTTAEVLAVEQAIAESIEALVDRDGPAVPAAFIENAIERKEAELGHPMTEGQRSAVRHVCGSGRGVTVVVGVAGSGKTTALDAATDALTAVGFSVIGTATSGQAARTLGSDAGIESRTVASLLARLDRGQLTLDERTVVILDEASMTADVDLYRLVVGIHRANAALVLIGDPRQLSSVGPGGALDAVLDRHPNIVTTLADNVRQLDPDERMALEQLRDGSVDNAVGWYARAGRTVIAPTRTEVLAAMVDAWADDLAAGHDTALLAWRRQDVADLNRLARAHADQTNRLHRPDVIAPGGRAYAAGDIVVLLAPVPAAGLVTSQRGRVAAVDRDSRSIIVDVGDQQVHLAGEQIDAQHLDYGYATTVHRAQGATFDRAHVFADGGGRELAYVAMSRARQCTTLHAVADTTAQAIDDIRTDWSIDRHQRWVTQTAAPAPDGMRARPVDVDRTARRVRLEEERERLLDLAPPDPFLDIVRANDRRKALKESLCDLEVGAGQWRNTDAGEVARGLVEAKGRRRQAGEFAHLGSWSSRRHWRAEARRWAEREQSLQCEWERIGEPIAHELTLAIDVVDGELSKLQIRRWNREQWMSQRPEVQGRLEHIERTLELDKTQERLRNVRGIEGHDLGIEL
jgi:conjugative relaxase-like TrwC/TraI family protein